MLVLSRYPGEQIIIGDNIYITVVEIKGDRVRLGITAPDDVHVDREEVRQAREREARIKARQRPPWRPPT